MHCRRFQPASITRREMLARSANGFGASRRKPDATETAEARAFLAARATESGERAAWSDFCHVLFNVKEFAFIP